MLCLLRPLTTSYGINSFSYLAFVCDSDSKTIFAFLFTFNSLFICSYTSFGIQKRKIHFYLR